MSAYFIVGLGLTGCTAAGNLNGSIPQNPDSEVPIVKKLVVSSYAITALSETSFNADIFYRHDANKDSSVSIFYCNETDSPGCDPSAGAGVLMARGTTKFNVTILGLSSPNDPGDSLNVLVDVVDNDGVEGAPSGVTITLPYNSIVTSNLQISNISVDGFDVSADYLGDQNQNSSTELCYCNETDSASCSPSAGICAEMTQNTSDFTKSISGLLSPYDQGDVLNISVSTTDSDGVSSSPLTTSITLDTVSALDIGTIVTANHTHVGFDITVPFTSDTNSDGVVTLYYCNQTDSPSCDPLAGDSQALTRGASDFTYTLTSMPAGYDIYEQVNVLVRGIDPDGVTGNDQGATIRLIDLEGSGVTVKEITETTFFTQWGVSNKDNNANVNPQVFFCNETQSPGCDPFLSTPETMYINPWESFHTTTHGANPGDTLTVGVRVSDVDGVYIDAQVGTSVQFSITIKIPNPVDIYRSVGPGQTTALANNTSTSATLSIAGDTATFTGGTIPDNIGVGDVLFFDSNGAATTAPDQLVFIHGRISNTEYTVKKVDGANPSTLTTNDSDWELYRAYTSASDAENGIENTGIPYSGLIDFDSFTNGKDISAQTGSDNRWNIALYAGIQADTTQLVQSGWTMDFANTLRFFYSL